MNKKIYIAAPFFNDDQVYHVKTVENLIQTIDGLDFYSPRMDGVLKDMTPEARAMAAPEVFARNCRMMDECHSLLALKQYRDEGTIWETGYVFGSNHIKLAGGGKPKPIFAYYPGAEPINVMSAQCFDRVLEDFNQLGRFLKAYRDGVEAKLGWLNPPDQY